MSARRPTQVPRWAWGNSATLVQPPALSAENGFAAAQRPPAPWFNWTFNAIGAWLDFLRSPNVSQWERTAWATSPGSYDASSPVLLAVDATTLDATGAAYRIAIAGWETSGPTSSLQVSQTGAAWTRRTNLPGGFSKPTALAHLACAPRWVIADDTPALYYAPHDAGAGTSPIGGSSSAWTSCSGTSDDGSGGLTAIKALASSSSKAVALTTAGGLHSADGVTWAAITEGTARTGNGLDVVWTGSAFVYVTSDGEVFNGTVGDAFDYKTTLPDGAADWRLAVGDVGEVIAYQHNNGSAVDLFRSTNNGQTWTTLTPLATGRDVVRLTCLRWRDGVWMATSSVAPFLWTSNDGVNWIALKPDVVGAGALAAIAWDGSSWLAAGNGFVVRCPRGADPAPGDYVADGSPATLADAATLRGRRISTGTPSDGDTLVWNATLKQWEYAAAAASVAWGDITGGAATGRAVLGLESSPTLTGSAGSGSASVAAGVVTLGLGTGVVPGSWPNAPKAAGTHGRTFMALDVRARISSVTGGNDGNVYSSLRVYQDGTTSAGVLANLRMNGGSLTLIGVGVSGGGTLASTSAPSRSDIASGQMWLRILFAGPSVSLLWGVGSGGAEPAEWVLAGSTTNTTGWVSSVFANVIVALDAGPSGSPDDVTVVWRDVSARGLS